MKPLSYTPSEEVSFRIEELIAAIGGSLPRHPASRFKLRRALTAIAATAFRNGRAFEQLQLAASLRAIPHEAREAHATGLKQAL